jgi:hypothetical protein
MGLAAVPQRIPKPAGAVLTDALPRRAGFAPRPTCGAAWLSLPDMLSGSQAADEAVRIENHSTRMFRERVWGTGQRQDPGGPGFDEDRERTPSPRRCAGEQWRNAAPSRASARRVMPAAHNRLGQDVAPLHPLQSTRLGSMVAQPQLRPRLMISQQVGGKKLAPMSLVQDDYLVQKFAADGSRSGLRSKDYAQPNPMPSALPRCAS